jgi:hypothetical protein
VRVKIFQPENISVIRIFFVSIYNQKPEQEDLPQVIKRTLAIELPLKVTDIYHFRFRPTKTT